MRIAAFWGLGSFSATAMLNGVSVVLLFFLVTYVQLEPALAGALLFGSKLLDLFTDPPMGLISDRTQSRLGRRRPWLLGSSVFCGLSFALLFNVPDVPGGGVLLFLVPALALYALSYTAFDVPYMAMAAEMTDDTHQRTRIMSWRVVFMTLGNMTGTAVAPNLAKAFGGDRAAYGDMGLVLGAAIFVTMLLTFLGTRGARQTEQQPEPLQLKRQLHWLAANRPLIVLVSMKALIYIGISAFTAVMLFFISSVLKREAEALIYLAIAQATATIAFTPVWSWVARRTGKKPAYVMSLLGLVAVILSWAFAQPGEPDLGFLVRGVGLGAFSAGSFLFGNSMLLDAMVHDYSISRTRREGVLSAAFSFVEKTSLALGPLVIGALLSAMGFDKTLPPDADQGPEAVRAMYMGFVWIPVACQLGATALLRFYRLPSN